MSGGFGRALDQKITTRMPREELETHLIARLKEVRMCSLATSLEDQPRATPLEYFTDGLTIYIGPDPGTKTRNLRTNPRVSLSMCNTLQADFEHAWDKVWAIQITGQGRLYEAGTPEQARAREVIDFAAYFRALNRDYTVIPADTRILKIVPEKIEMNDFSLIGRGFCHRQVWRAVKG
jgi:nitroimidazol reductase NimA-like FMN-containing flavoprotein (pyridoxamine 5'-phosphate oxidase superfamily)